MVCRIDSSSQLQVITILDYACVVWDPHFKKDKELLESIQLFATHMAAKSWHGRPNQYTFSHHSHQVKNIYMGFIICPLITLFSTPPPILETNIVSGVGSNRTLRGPQIQIVGVALITEFCDHNIPFLNVVFW